MATTNISATFSLQPRLSTSTERRHLFAESIAPSESASMMTFDDGDGDRTPRAHSPAPSTSSTAHERRATVAAAAPTTYRGFASEAAYLAALNEWAESKKYLQSTTDATLLGFYGQTTLEEYAQRPGMEGLGLRKKWRARREARQADKMARRNTVV